MATSTTFEYTDPRTLDGTPFDVAGAAAQQASKIIELAAVAAADAFVMARVAEMERQIQRGVDPHGSTFADEPLGRRLVAMTDQLDQLVSTALKLGAAASYNPRNPPKELTA
jgi:hypothetical protein